MDIVQANDSGSGEVLPMAQEDKGKKKKTAPSASMPDTGKEGSRPDADASSSPSLAPSKPKPAKALPGDGTPTLRKKTTTKTVRTSIPVDAPIGDASVQASAGPDAEPQPTSTAPPSSTSLQSTEPVKLKKMTKKKTGEEADGESRPTRLTSADTTIPSTIRRASTNKSATAKRASGTSQGATSKRASAASRASIGDPPMETATDAPLASDAAAEPLVNTAGRVKPATAAGDAAETKRRKTVVSKTDSGRLKRRTNMAPVEPDTGTSPLEDKAQRRRSNTLPSVATLPTSSALSAAAGALDGPAARVRSPLAAVPTRVTVPGMDSAAVDSLGPIAESAPSGALPGDHQPVQGDPPSSSSTPLISRPPEASAPELRAAEPLVVRRSSQQSAHRTTDVDASTASEKRFGVCFESEGRAEPAAKSSDPDPSRAPPMAPRARTTALSRGDGVVAPGSGEQPYFTRPSISVVQSKPSANSTEVPRPAPPVAIAPPMAVVRTSTEVAWNPFAMPDLPRPASTARPPSEAGQASWNPFADTILPVRSCSFDPYGLCCGRVDCKLPSLLLAPDIMLPHAPSNPPHAMFPLTDPIYAHDSSLRHHPQRRNGLPPSQSLHRRSFVRATRWRPCDMPRSAPLPFSRIPCYRTKD